MEWLTNLHSVWRYAVLVTAFSAILLSLLAYFGVRGWDRLTDRSSLLFTVALDIQVLIGILVWVFASWDRSDNILLWIHPLLMLAAVGLAHMGRVLSERDVKPKSKGGRAAMFFIASLLVILVAIPFASWPV